MKKLEKQLEVETSNAIFLVFQEISKVRFNRTLMLDG